MLAKNSRIKRNNDFDLVFKEKRSIYGQFLGLKIRSNNLLRNRFGVLLGTKVSKLAVLRNTYKRRVKRVLSLEDKKLKTGNDLVVIVLPAIVGKKYQEIENEIKTILSKLKLYS
jgi:ribonuclease P protein component